MKEYYKTQHMLIMMFSFGTLYILPIWAAVQGVWITAIPLALILYPSIYYGEITSKTKL